MLRTINGPTVSKLVSTSKGSIKRVGSSNVVYEASIVAKANTRSSKAGTEFYIFGVKLVFAKLR